jgi:hypothetical protein
MIKKFEKHCSRLSKELSTPSNMLDMKATQTMHNHVVEEIHRCYTKVYTSSKISKKKNCSMKQFCIGVQRKAQLVLAGVKIEHTVVIVKSTLSHVVCGVNGHTVLHYIQHTS